MFDKELRRSVIFGRHDLIQDAPISRVNVLMCRNTLMYFNNEAQSRILARFHFGLGDSGVLFLGKAEMLLTLGHLFAPLELKRRVFRKVSKDNWRERMAIMTQANAEETLEAADAPSIFPAIAPARHASSSSTATLPRAFQHRAARAVQASPERLASRCRTSSATAGRTPIADAQTLDQRRPVTLREVLWEAVGHAAKYFDVHVVPLYEQGGRAVGVSVSFVDVSRVQDLQVQLNRSKRDLETAYEELQSTNEELETTNEELQSTVETGNDEEERIDHEEWRRERELQSTTRRCRPQRGAAPAQCDLNHRTALSSILTASTAGRRARQGGRASLDPA